MRNDKSLTYGTAGSRQNIWKLLRKNRRVNTKPPLIYTKILTKFKLFHLPILWWTCVISFYRYGKFQRQLNNLPSVTWQGFGWTGFQPTLISKPVFFNIMVYSLFCESDNINPTLENFAWESRERDRPITRVKFTEVNFCSLNFKRE